jgi:KUP system potassium uptake protein
LQNLRHNHALHKEIILLSVMVEEIPHIPQGRRIEVQHLQDGFYQVLLHYGFMEDPNVPRDLVLAQEHGLAVDPEDVTYFLGRERVLPSNRPGMARWREHLFALMSRNARNATDFFRLPPDKVVEMGAQVEI